MSNTLFVYNLLCQDTNLMLFSHSLLQTQKSSIISKKQNTARVPFLKLEPSRSYMKPGDSLEIECSSSVGPHVAVKWERPGGHPLPYNFEVISI